MLQTTIYFSFQDHFLNKKLLSLDTVFCNNLSKNNIKNNLLKREMLMVGKRVINPRPPFRQDLSRNAGHISLLVEALREFCVRIYGTVSREKTIWQCRLFSCYLHTSFNVVTYCNLCSTHYRVIGSFNFASHFYVRNFYFI